MSLAVLSRADKQEMLGAMDTLGRYLRALREQRGISQTALAAHVGLSRSHMGQIESGKIGLPSADIRRRLAKALGVSHVDLLIAAGELTEDEVGPLVGVVEPNPDDPREQLIATIRASAMPPDYARFLADMIAGWTAGQAAPSQDRSAA